MTLEINVTKAFVLRTLKYQETSLLVDVFSLEYGRISLLARGAKGARSTIKAALQSFIPLNITFGGRQGTLRVIKKIEEARNVVNLIPPFLYVGLYANELIATLYKTEESSVELFGIMSELFSVLEKQGEYEFVLRKFEMTLLAEIGKGIDLFYDACGQKITPNCCYKYIEDQGFIEVDKELLEDTPIYFKGISIIAFRDGIFSEPCIRNDIKNLCTHALSSLLENHRLVSRDIYFAYLQNLNKKS